MMFMDDNKAFTGGHRVIFTMVLCLFVMAIASLTVFAAPRKKTKKKAVDDRVYLIHADELRYDQYGPNPDAQIVKGHVSFRHQGAHLSCDSAYFYQGTNSVKAFGHVRFRQGDTLSLVCDHAWYDGENQLMQARKNVVLHHRRQVLYTDSLNYDRLYEYAYFFNGGRLVDGKTKLSSDWGEYHMATKEAKFNYDVQVISGTDRISTDTLYYDTRTSRAHIVGLYTPNKGNGTTTLSRIVSKGTTVTTLNGYFNTRTSKADLYGRSTVVDKQKTITADTLLYNSKTGDDHARGKVLFVDKQHKNILNCSRLDYNEKTGRGMAIRGDNKQFQDPFIIDYSQKDTLFANAERARIETHFINTDSVWRKVHLYPHVRAYRVDAQAICDSLVFCSLDSCMRMYRDPIVWNASRQLLGDSILVYMNDSTVRQANVLGNALSVELMPDSTHYNQVSCSEMYAYFIDGAIRRNDAVSNVRSIYFPVDDKDSTLIGLNYTETDTMRMFITAERKLQRIWMPKAEGTIYPMTQIPPNRFKLDVFQWYADIRPRDRYDLYDWRPKNAPADVKPQRRQAPPLQNLAAEGTAASSPVASSSATPPPVASSSAASSSAAPSPASPVVSSGKAR